MKIAIVATHGVIPQAQFGFQDQVSAGLLTALNESPERKKDDTDAADWQMSVVFPTVAPPAPADPIAAQKAPIVRIYRSGDDPEQPRGDFFDVHEAYWSPIDKGLTNAASVAAWLVRTIFLPFNDVARYRASPNKVAWDVGFILTAMIVGLGLLGLGFVTFAWSVGSFNALLAGTPVHLKGSIDNRFPFLHADYARAINYLLHPLTLFSLSTLQLVVGVVGAYLFAQAVHAISSVLMNRADFTRDPVQWRLRWVAISVLLAVALGLLAICYGLKIPHTQVKPGFIAIVLVFALLFVKGGQSLAFWFVANFFGDVQIYTTRDNNAAFFRVRQAILDLVTRTILDVIQTPPDHPEYDRVYIFGHSLGSTISLDALMRIYNMKREGLVAKHQYDKIRGFVTFGTALEKTKYFFDVWSPSLTAQYEEWRNDLYGSLFTAERSALEGDINTGIYWLNCWYFSDFVSDRIASYRSIVEPNMPPSTATRIRSHTLRSGRTQGKIANAPIERLVAENRKRFGPFAPQKFHFVTHGDYLQDSWFWNAARKPAEFGALDVVMTAVAARGASGSLPAPPPYFAALPPNSISPLQYLVTRATAPLKMPNYAIQPVYYATDRQQLLDAVDIPRFGADRATLGQLAFGRCELSIPRSHRVGELESPSIWRLEFRSDPEKHISIVRGAAYSSADLFFEALRASFVAESSAFVFVHGYNVTFSDALCRTGQLAYDLQFPGTAIAYSWPSAGTFNAYPLDANNIEWTRPHLESFLLELKKTGVERVHIVAHSMGNRAVSTALYNLSKTNPEAKFTNIVLTAPDIDREVFLQLAAAISSTAGRVTLYASDRDKALLASKSFNGLPRAGDCRDGIVICKDMVSIDVSDIDTEFLGHGYYAENSSIIGDLHYVIRGEAPPRYRLRPETTAQGSYWKFVR